MNDNLITVDGGGCRRNDAFTLASPVNPRGKHSTFNAQHRRTGSPEFEQKPTKLTKGEPERAALRFLGDLLFKIRWFAGKAGKNRFVLVAESPLGIECPGPSFSLRHFSTKVRVGPSKSDL
jgi:hypothetical protein